MAAEIIARDPELSLVHAFLDLPDARTRALVLEGEAGIGKSTLWTAGVAAARQRLQHVLTSRPAESERSFANVVLGDILGEIPDEIVTALPGPRRRAFEGALLRGEADDAPVDARALAAAVLTILTSLAVQGPLLLAIDDDQWADESSIGALGFALRRLADAPIRVLLTRRAGDGPATAGTAQQPLESNIEPESVERVQLGPLSVGAIQLLLRSRLGITLSRPNLLRLAEASGGNAFFALELARAQPPAASSPGPLVVPSSLERLLVGRLDRLADDARRALLLIAAHGRTPLDVLRRLNIPAPVLDRAVAEQLVDSSAGIVRFTHPLLASAVYQRASPEERRAAHLELATAVDEPIGRAHHLAVGTTEPSVEVSASIESASSLAATRGTPIAAAELAEDAARLTPPGSVEDRHRRLIAAGRARVRGGDSPRALAIAQDLLAASPSGTPRADALMLRAALEPPGLAVPLLEDALVEAAGSVPLEAAIHARLAVVGRFIHGVEWAERHGQALLRLAERLDDDSLRTTALTTLALLEFDRADPRGLARAQEAHRIATSIGDPATRKDATLALGYILAWSGMTGPARTWLEREIPEWLDRDEQVRGSLVWCLGLVEVASGRWSAAAEHAEQALEISNAYEQGPGDHFLPALVALHRGEFEAAREHARLALQRPDGEFLEDFMAILGTCDAWSGHLDTALGQFERAEQTADARGWRDASLRYWLPDHVETLVRLGRVDEARRLLDAWEASTVGLDRPRVHAQAIRCRGLIAGASGELPIAMTLLEQAVAREEAADDPFGHARALLALGIVRRRARQKRGAREALEAALDSFQRLGAATWVSAARGELARIGGRQRLGSLSASEARVAQLVVEGRTNREIASALFLSERTVASHLTHVYAKLGLRSRTELAAHTAVREQTSIVEPSKVPTS